MIIKRKLFTRQEARAMKELYEALRNGNLGRNLSAKEFVKLRHVGNETIDALSRQDKGNISDFSKNSEIIKNLGLPETSKAYKKIIEKYTNPEARLRLSRIQKASSNNRLRKLRQRKKELEDELSYYDNVTSKGKSNLNNFYGKDNIKAYNANRNSISEDYRDTLEEIEKIKKERGSKNFKFNKKEWKKSAIKEHENLKSLHEEAKNQARDYKAGTKTRGAETSWRIKNQLQKEGANAKIDGNKGSYYNRKLDKIHVNRGDSRDPLTVLHEFGHKLSKKRGEVSGMDEGYYNGWEKLDEMKNSGDNLAGSIMNRISDLTTLTEEANASYHATARAKRYGVSNKQLKQGKSILDNAFKTYERDAAMGINHDNYIRNLGKARNK